jgi:hypothetical protein
MENEASETTASNDVNPEQETTEEAVETPAENESQEEATEEVEEIDELESLREELKRTKQFSRQHETREKELVKEKKAWETKRLSLEGELHKVKTELTDLKKAQEEAKVSSLKSKAISEYKLPEGAVKHLSGETEEEIAASAADLAELFGVKTLTKKGVISTKAMVTDIKSELPQHHDANQQYQAATKK